MIRGSAKIALGIAAAAFACSGPLAADDIKIGAIYDLTGPFAGGGSKPASIGNKIAIDMVNERGGAEGAKIVRIFLDAQVKIDGVIDSAQRPLHQQQVGVLIGVHSR